MARWAFTWLRSRRQDWRRSLAGPVCDEGEKGPVVGFSHLCPARLDGPETLGLLVRRERLGAVLDDPTAVPVKT